MRDKSGKLIYVAAERRCSTIGCAGAAVTTCKFELRGKKAGSVCDRKICAACSKGGLCVSHSRFVASQSFS